MADAQMKTTHEDVVEAIRKALLDAIKNTTSGNWSDDVLKLGQAYERIESAGCQY